MLRTWPVRLPAIEVHVVGEVLPDAGDAAHLRLAAELALGADFAGDAGHLRRRSELSWSTIVLIVFFSSRISPFTSTVIFLREVAVGDRGRHVGDVAHLGREVGGHGVDVVGEVLPGPADALDLGLAAELSLGADLAGDARHLRRRSELSWSTIVLMVFFSSRISPLHVDRDLLREVAVRDRGRHLGDVAHLGVRLPAIRFTLSVRSFQVPATPAPPPGRRAFLRCPLRGPRG